MHVVRRFRCALRRPDDNQPVRPDAVYVLRGRSDDLQLRRIGPSGVRFLWRVGPAARIARQRQRVPLTSRSTDTGFATPACSVGGVSSCSLTARRRGLGLEKLAILVHEGAK
jgi:hypothetical protein